MAKKKTPTVAAAEAADGYPSKNLVSKKMEAVLRFKGATSPATGLLPEELFKEMRPLFDPRLNAEQEKTARGHMFDLSGPPPPFNTDSDTGAVYLQESS